MLLSNCEHWSSGTFIGVYRTHQKKTSNDEATYSAHLLRFGCMNYLWSVMLTFQEEQAEMSVVL